MACEIPTYNSIAEFAREHGLAYMTVVNHMKRGVCKWPRKITTGKTKHPLYKTWENMHTRCRNKNTPGFSSYGGRGIKIHPRWYEFKNFLEDMGEKPDSTHTLDRINVDGDYEPENCRWADPRTQALNTRRSWGSVLFTDNGWRVEFQKCYIGRFKTKQEAQQALDNHLDEIFGDGVRSV